ncbi:MAG: hypothetical protein AAF734_00005, partial [Bacteroidota bacterium]
TNYSYDQNGNITQLQRRDAAGNLLDNITYTYETDENGNKINRLQEVNDPTVTADPSEIEGKHGFAYDHQGNLSRDEKEQTNIDWNNQNKVHQVRQEEADKAHITFRYDATGNRIEKEVNRNDLLADGSRSYADPTKVTTTYYVRDAQGNVMSIYEKTHRQKDDGSYESVLTQKETYLYGSDRLGVDRQERIVGIVSSATAAEAMAAEITAPEIVNTNSDTPPSSNGLLPNGDEVIVEPTSKDTYEDRSYWVLNDATTTPGASLDLTEGFEADLTNAEGFFAEIAAWEDIRTEEEVYAQRIIGKKQYELKDHLSNVRVVLSDQKEVVNIDETAGTYEQKAKVLAYYNYYPFGWEQQARVYQQATEGTVWGFQGQLTDREWGGGQVINYLHRGQDPRYIRFYNIDPLSPKYPWYSPYQFSGNRPIDRVELEGLEEAKFMTTQYDAVLRNATHKEKKIYREAQSQAATTATVVALDLLLFKGWLSRSFAAYEMGNMVDNMTASERALARGDKATYEAKQKQAGVDATYMIGGELFSVGISRVSKYFQLKLPKSNTKSRVKVRSPHEGLDVREAVFEMAIKPGAKIEDIVSEAIYMTRSTGVEHALVQLKDGSRHIVSGGKHGIRLPSDTDILFGHTHPPLRKGELNTPSLADRKALDLLDQSKQYIFHDGQRTTIYRGKGSEADRTVTDY